jgi:2-polyprenyl-3-methyl-5-hydroxy-6-metoxy-1,4-benzoquinol methylase
MREDEKQRLVELYQRRYDEIGHGVRTLGWHGKSDQWLRFKVLCDISDLSGASICDIGCGYGDLATYLALRFKNFSYTGIDITQLFLERARQQHPEHEFLWLDILEENFARRFDYFFLSGALNFRVRDNMKLTTAMLRKMFELSKKGVGINFLSTYVTYQKEQNFHHNPEALFAFARTLTKWVILRHDYPLWEFTLYLYAEPPMRSRDE